MSSIVLLVVMVILILLNAPISYALAMAGIVFFFQHGLSGIQFIVKLAGGIDIFTLLAAPLFIFAGNIMNQGGITDRIFNFANSIVGHIRGGLGHVNILASMMFAGMSGSAIADAAGLGPIEIKAMTDHGFDLDFSIAVTGASAVIGPIIPPSTIMIVYGVTAEVSISRMFLGGIIPGIIIGVSEMVMVYWYARKRNYPRNGSFSFRNLLREFRKSILALLTAVIIMGGILAGIFTATEAGAFAALYAVFISVFVYKELTLKQVWDIMCDTAKTSGCILILVGTASIFGWCLVFEKAPQAVAALLVTLTSNKILILIMFAAVYIFLGMIMEATAIIVTTVPIVVPLFKILGIDLVYFGVLICIIMAIGTITPPVGTCMFVLCNMTNTPIERFTKSIMPWLVLLILIVLALILCPALITAIPNMVKG
ncbi:Sialic acid TRAP transporter permease protein SiaT [bioreactor metagenome]|uniref:Sialic acid TRAP transporter permease protein SiaT n=1 Tax=bioreactor metagenome TaxID=1076179 RepID=A0A644YNI8_9ZZZZ